MRWLVLLLLVAAGCAGAPPPGRTVGHRISHGAGGQETDDEIEDERETATRSPSDAEAAALERAFEARMTVHVRRDGSRVLSRRCREGPVPCADRIAVFATIIAEVARRHGLDPFLLGALAFRESGLDPAAVGPSGAAGIVQLHPRGVGRGMRYVVDADHRAQCQTRVDACQRPVVERGAEALARAIEECGSLRSALGAYATGHCTEHARHAERVIAEQAHLRALADP